jgi:hypothetical protein
VPFNPVGAQHDASTRRRSTHAQAPLAFSVALLSAQSTLSCLRRMDVSTKKRNCPDDTRQRSARLRFGAKSGFCALQKKAIGRSKVLLSIHSFSENVNRMGI